MASQAELQWWDRFAGVMAKQWNLTPAMNDAIRSAFERDYEAFLWRAGGTLLDVGCGTGVRTHALAKRGMQVDGIDFSASQLTLARELAHEARVPNVEFFRRDLVHDEWAGRHRQYDSVFVCALLHHLSYDELELVFARLAECLKPGGVAYLYEPILTRRRSWLKGLAFKGLDLAWRVALIAYMRLGRAAGVFDPEIRDAMRQGYTGTSPDERALEYERLQQYWDRAFELLDCRPVHEYSIGYAMSVMLLQEHLRPPLERLAPLMYRADRALFRLGMWENAGAAKRWILCAVKLRRKAV
jgi:cyclopropane fatty-acyl-phospholipid synthase-like methyltransferase